MEDSAHLASLFGSYLAKGDLKPLLEYEKHINSLKAADIKSVANSYFYKNNSTTVILKYEDKK
jgi:predicted Zn-dependent peptidase